jgi:hypothetical protein
LQRFAAEPPELRGALERGVQALSAARDMRLTVAAGHIPVLLWRAMLICAVIVLAFAALTHANQARASRWMTLLLGLFIGVQVHAVYVIDRPFEGAIAIGDAPLRAGGAAGAGGPGRASRATGRRPVKSGIRGRVSPAGF